MVSMHSRVSLHRAGRGSRGRRRREKIAPREEMRRYFYRRSISKLYSVYIEQRVYV